jgi:hypothetical protein
LNPDSGACSTCAMRSPMVWGFRKSKGVPLTGRISPVGICVGPTGVSAARGGRGSALFHA